MHHRERHGSKMAFLAGLPPERLRQLFVDPFKQRGGEIKYHATFRLFTQDTASIEVDYNLGLDAVAGHALLTCSLHCASVTCCSFKILPAPQARHVADVS